MQRIGRHTVAVDVGVQFPVGPIEQGVVLEDTCHAVPFNFGRIRAVLALGGTQTGDPNLGPIQCPFERINLADPAASFARLHRFENGRHSLFVDKRLQRLRVRDKGVKIDVGVHGPSAVDQVVGFVEQTSRVQSDQTNWQLMPRNQICQSLILQPQRGGEHHLPGKLFAQVRQAHHGIIPHQRQSV